MRFADLHVHTNASDGTLSPENLVKECLKARLSAIAIADHDTLDSVQPAINCAKDSGLEVIPALELTAQHEGQEIHMLGYFLDHRNKNLISKLKIIQQNRIERVFKIIENLKNIGIELSSDTVFGISGKSTVGRMHIAKAMVKEGRVSSIPEAFRKYIGDSSPAYVLGFTLSVKEAIDMIHEASGLAVLAHPYLLHNDQLIVEFTRLGLDGIEIYYPEHSQGLINLYLELAKKHNLLVTGGSDFHGAVKPDVKLGTIKLPMDFVEKMRQRKNEKT